MKYLPLVCAALCVLAGCEGVAALFHGEKPRAKYTVTFDGNGATSGTVPSQSASAGDAITLPSGAGLSFAGKTFKGWNTNTIGTGAHFAGGSPYRVDAHIRLYAEWESAGERPNGTFSGTVWRDASGENGVAFDEWNALLSGTFWTAYDGRTLESEYRSGESKIVVWISRSESKGYQLTVGGDTLTVSATGGATRSFFRVISTS